MARLYALLVGINDYPEPTRKLGGCLNDLGNAHDYLKTAFPEAAIVVLKDAEATRANVIGQFRTHLGQAGSDDVAMFQYCGHGAPTSAAPEFHAFDLDNRDQGLVLYDSRDSDSTFDLADKELALLVAELAAKDPHIAMIFDCCHSGSGTRAIDHGPQVGVRTTSGRFPPRPLETYLEGQYAAMVKAGKPLAVPQGRHMLIAACDRTQTAKESGDTVLKGYFSTALYDVLRKSGTDIGYAELFTRTRAAVRQAVRDTGVSDQEPQFEPVAGFDAYTGFLGRAAKAARKTYSVARGDAGWQVEAGAIHGLPTDPAVPVMLTLHPEGDGASIAGTARATSVGATTSAIALDFEANPIARFAAEISSMPQAALLVAFDGDEGARATVDAALASDDKVNVTLVARGADDGFVLAVEGAVLTLRQTDTGKMIKSAAVGSGGDWAKPMVAALGHVAQWRRSLALANPHPRLNPDQVEFVFAEKRPDGTELVHPGPSLTIELAKVGEAWPRRTGQLRLRNRTGQKVHYAVLVFSPDYGVMVAANDQLLSSEDYQTILFPSEAGTPDPDVYFSVDRGTEALEQLKVIFSTERVDDFLLALEPLSDTRGFGSASDPDPDAAKPIGNDWLTKDLRVKVVRQLDQVGPAEIKLADGQITIEPHPLVTASVTLSTAVGASRGADDGDDFAIARRLAAAGLSMASVGGTRGDSPNILELSDIGNADALAAVPLTIRVNMPLSEGEAMVAMVQDGPHILLAGDCWRDDDGTTRVEIAKLPGGDVGQRSVLGSLKMYFFKTYLHSDSVNQLRWIEYRDDGSYVAHADGVAAKVAAASNILVAIHGIIGDTAAMVAGVRAAGLDAKFDLVLAYDYENLATPIDQTAKLLQDDLARVGIRADDGKRVTILAHSMGGLVSRRMIEQDGGGALIDHLVMCGTPNGGSPLGRIDSARQLLMMIATVAAYGLPQFCGPAIMLLTRSKKLTPTLEQMAPRSPFMAALNASPAPSTRYSILAGDIDRYQDADDAFFDELLVKAGRGPLFDALFSSGPNDIAVAVPSIFGEAIPAVAAATHTDVACHHLNYFSTAVGRDALTRIDWTS